MSNFSFALREMANDPKYDEIKFFLSNVADYIDSLNMENNILRKICKRTVELSESESEPQIKGRDRTDLEKDARELLKKYPTSG